MVIQDPPPSDGYNPHDNHMPTGINMSRHHPQPEQFSILNQAKSCPTIGVYPNSNFILKEKRPRNRISEPPGQNKSA